MLIFNTLKNYLIKYLNTIRTKLFWIEFIKYVFN